MSRRRLILGFLLVALMFVGVRVFLPVEFIVEMYSLYRVIQEEYKLFRSIKVGMTESEVVRLLGKPYQVWTAEEAPGDYYVPGYSRKERPISNKVFIYVATEPIAYIYFDEEDKVEDVFVGGS